MSHPIRVLDGATVDRIVSELDPEELISLMHRVFSTLSSPTPLAPKDLSCPPRTTTHSNNHATLFMPSRIAAAGGTGIKIVSVPTSPNAPPGLPATTLLMNEETGSVEAMINAGQLTAVRNAAGSALATRLSGVSSPLTLLLFGAGAQITHHALLFLTLYPSITHCIIINRSLNSRLISLVQRIRDKFPKVEIEGLELGSRQVEEWLGKADIVVCATSSKEALFDEKSLKPTAHLNLIGSYTPQMREIAPSLIASPLLKRIIVDSIESCITEREAGDLASVETSDRRLVELGALCLQDSEGGEKERKGGEKEGYGEREGWTLFKSVGVGVQDVAIARLVFDEAEKRGLGVLVDF